MRNPCLRFPGVARNPQKNPQMENVGAAGAEGNLFILKNIFV